MRDRRRSSFTAEAAAAARAYGAMQDDPKLRGPDAMAIRLVGGLFRFLLLPGIRRRFVQEYERRAAGVFFHHQARTKHIDAVLAGELAASVGGAAQVVFLGAGLDSRAYRFASALRGTRVFEVDHPATSAIKQQRVRRVLGALPAHVSYVPLDFAKEDLGQRLAAANYDPARVTLFIWEGVTPYLPAAAIDTTLALVARAAERSSIVFDYLHASALGSADPSVQKHLALAARRGEPYQFGVEPSDLAALLARHGLALEENLSAEDLGARYLVGSDGTRWGKVTPFLSLAQARRVRAAS
jgi:methyltransferase (TIGR00027 family)